MRMIEAAAAAPGKGLPPPKLRYSRQTALGMYGKVSVD
jgi:hypothetical protein